MPITGHFSANDLDTYVHTSVPRFPSISIRSKGCSLSWFEDIGKERRKKVGPYNSGLVQIMERGQPWNNCEVRISIFFLVSLYVRDVGMDNWSGELDNYLA